MLKKRIEKLEQGSGFKQILLAHYDDEGLIYCQGKTYINKEALTKDLTAQYGKDHMVIIFHQNI